MLDFYVVPTGITVFSKTTCSYCIKAKEVLTKYSVSLQVYELNIISNGQIVANELKRQTMSSTVPSIFIYGKYIGGFYELEKMHNSGELLKIIKENKKIKPSDYFVGWDEWGKPN
jgi:glutaredoxin 3